MMDRKPLVLVVIVLAAALLLAIGLKLSHHGDNSRYTPVSSTVSPAAARQFEAIISNLDTYKARLSTNDVDSIQHAIYTNIKKYRKSADSYYAAVIRPGTFSSAEHEYDGTSPPSQIPTVKFVVDIPAVKQSYLVSLAGGDTYAYNILYVLCPSAAQLRYGNFGCVDEDN